MKRLLILAFSLLALPVQAALEVFATGPEWAALAKEIGGERVNARSATHGLQDVHRIEARPSLIARARRADLVIATGAELEVGWLPVVLRESGNAAIQPGKAGYFEAAAHVRMLDVPKALDRIHGDVHAAGNPHFVTDARVYLKIGEALASRLAALDAANAAAYQAGYRAFAERWRAALARWEAQAKPLGGVPVVVQHDAFVYLEDWLGLKRVATLEPKPGVEPGAAYLQEVLARLAAQPARMVLRPAYQHDASSRWIAERAKLPIVTLPMTVGGTAEAKDLYRLFDDTIARLLAAPGN